jgi:hypothetical protein
MHAFFMYARAVYTDTHVGSRAQLVGSFPCAASYGKNVMFTLTAKTKYVMNAVNYGLMTCRGVTAA